MNKTGWYVIQVQTGKEQAMCTAVERICASDGERPLVRECFSPKFRHRLKYDGVWQEVEKPLLPGYVIAVTDQPDRLARRLRRTPEFARVLSMGETFVPLRDDERAWMEEFTTAGERVIPISVGHRKGDRIEVTEGPLKGHEGMIVRVIRKKCLALLELHVDGKRITTSVGLAVVPEETR